MYLWHDLVNLLIELTLQGSVVAVRTNSFKIQQFYVLSTKCISGFFYMDLKK